jgi:hypothetical protein
MGYVDHNSKAGLTDMYEPRVFISNYGGHDYEAASGYGELKWITKGFVSHQSLDRLKYQIAEEVLKTDKEDWLLLSGKPLICAVTALLWFAIHRKVKLLVWDQKGKGVKYRELIISEGNMAELFNVIGAS